jgi:Leucine-rich repeat (LRR) protein
MGDYIYNDEADYYSTVEKYSWIYNLWKWADDNNIVEADAVFDEIGQCTTYRGIPRDKQILENRTYIDLSDCNLNNIPEDIGNLIKLKELNLSENNLVELPYSILNLENLEVLNISENNISTIYDELCYLKKLHIFNSAGNPIVYFPECLQGKDI